MKKHLRLTFHFTIDANTSSIPVGENEETAAYNERQERLFDAMVHNKTVLDQFQRYLLVSWFELQNNHMDDLLLEEITPDEPWGHRETKAILVPIIATMSQEDQQFFAEVDAEDIFYENTELFQDCFSTDLARRELQEVEDE